MTLLVKSIRTASSASPISSAGRKAPNAHLYGEEGNVERAEHALPNIDDLGAPVAVRAREVANAAKNHRDQRLEFANAGGENRFLGSIRLIIVLGRQRKNNEKSIRVDCEHVY